MDIQTSDESLSVKLPFNTQLTDKPFFENLPSTKGYPVTLANKLPTQAGVKGCKIYVYDSAMHRGEQIKSA